MIHNWGWEPAIVPAAKNLTDILDGTRISPGTALQLRPWDVRVLAAEGEPRSQDENLG
ncbi:hypothetical protein GCM10011578_019310 [Streptomyces fuscichromogenes]|uniref:Beta-galactosidase C-terminal domain-containing protein n=2 Tax=Streptomyces fuscichromogenes TaxID=1324013 RepID=A0A918CNX4_9ACTN|nr:hypothetical protein GCM10011578_019310 [Streptomyces fuscichromogenes]